MKQKLIVLLVLFLITASVIFLAFNNGNKKSEYKESESTGGLISVLVDGVEQSAFPSKGSAEYQSTSCTNGEAAIWDAVNWKLSIQDISASTRCVVSFVTGGHNVYVTVSGGTVDNAPKQVNHNGNTTFTVASSNSNYVFSSVKCTGANTYSWANNVLSVNGITADAYCDVVFSRPTYTVYFNVTGGYTENNYVTVVRGGGNSTTFGAIAGYLTSGATITCDPGIEGRLAGTRIVVSNVMSSGDCNVVCSKDTSNYLPGGATYNKGDEVSYANLAWLVVGSDADSVTLILKTNATYSGSSGSNLTGTGIFGSGVVFTSSSARSYLQDIWLEQDAQKYLKSAIDSGGLIYQTDANGYVRLPYAAEVNNKLPNSSNTNFWTMDNDGAGHVYYGQPTGYLTEGKATDNKYYFEHYTLASNTSVNYTWADTLGSYYSTTTGGIYYLYRLNTDSSYKIYTNYHSYACMPSGPILGDSLIASTSTRYYLACAGVPTTSNYSSGGWTYNFNNYGCTSTCANRTCSATASITLNPFSGATYSSGSYSNGYRKWTKNVGTETKSSTATLNTTFTYTSTTTGNSGMTAAVQACNPGAVTARTNDSVPTTATMTFIDANVSASCTITGTFYQGYNTVSANLLSTNPTLTHATSNSKVSKTYVKYTLKAHNNSTMGYRPVIVVRKAN